MRVKALNVQLPVWVDKFFREEAERRMASKSMVVREVLTNYVREKQPEADPQFSKVAA